MIDEIQLQFFIEEALNDKKFKSNFKKYKAQIENKDE